MSHGNTLSIYFNDPEGNGLEVFWDTPWHVAQPKANPGTSPCQKTRPLPGLKPLSATRHLFKREKTTMLSVAMS